MEPASLTTLKRYLEKMLELMGFAFEIESKVDESKKEVFFCVHLKEGQHYLIGRQGVNLEALQHILRSMQHKIHDGFRYTLDVNHYLAEKKRKLQERVEQLVEEAGTAETEIRLWPMSAFERKAVHELFVDSDRFQTESVGRGPDRQVTIKKLQ